MASPITIPSFAGRLNNNSINVCYSSIYLFAILMKAVYSIFKSIPRRISGIIVYVLLSIIYILVVLPYSLLYKQYVSTWNKPFDENDKMISDKPW